ncbi:fungal specific transcription factor domain-containing protein [Colletotrichum scovillei]|uniref:fungal specific transcription factor domain-containing protein n=1 Tax=Colletotrichum scovillei TaxID=1209932 RepID=UPI0015C40BBE|nr:fungal specific transcription factor domain-containing protein [Colletotrichum scovillei]KAF4781536.1 fungal specific transcription factor domain-containing protein [Colletotrichum scovillei]
MENSTPGPTGASTRKRKRIPIACSSCRARKSRCDGVRPQCSACVEQGIECIYAANSGGSNALVPKQYLEQVEHRLADVEEEISRLKRLIPASFLQGKQHVLFPRSISGRTDDFSEVNYPEESLNVEDGSVTQGITPDATDGVGTIEFTTDESWAYFGPSSNIAFTRIIRRTLDHLLNKTQKDERGDASSTPAKHAQQHILAVSRSQSPVTDSFDSRKLEKPSEASRLPPEEEVINLVRQFFRDTGLLFPYIHEESFWKTYAQYRATGMQNAKTAWLALLQMVLAMATSTMNATGVGLGDRQAISEVHYRRAKALSMTEMMTGANVEAVQAMLLMSQYLQGSQRSIQTWAIHGLAVKAALELGFHSELALQRFEPLEREIRIRTWYGCVVLDSTLYGVTAAVIDDLYESNIGSISVIPLTNTVASVIQIGQKLADWQASLPLSMQLVEPSEVASPEGKLMLLKFRVILTLRYHNLQLLSHRPILDRCLQSFDGSPQSLQEAATLQQAWHLSRTVCLRSAEAIIRLVEACKLANDVQPTVSFLGAWWFSLYFTFNASLTIVATKLVEDSYGSMPFDQGYTNTALRLDDILKSAVSCIARLDIQNPMVEKCAKFTATLIFMVQSLQIAPGQDDITREVGGMGPSHAVASNGGENVQSTQISANGGMDDAFSNLMNYLPPNFNDFPNTGANFSMSELMDDFATGDLFW